MSFFHVANIEMPIVEAIIAVIALMITYTIKWITGRSVRVSTEQPYIGAHQALTPLQKKVGKEYRKFKTTGDKPTFREFCFPEKYTVQKQQLMLGEYLKPSASPKTCLVFHKIGAGKTCVMIQIAMKWMKRGKPLCLMPASLTGGFRSELRTKCAGDEFISDTDRKLLKTLNPNSAEYKDIVQESDAKINKAMTITSFDKFDEKTKAPILIIDEYNAVDNEKGSRYKQIISWIEKNEKSSIVILSGTPIFDNISEINAFAKFLRIEIPDNGITLDSIPKLFANKVSYFPGAPTYTFPKMEVIIKQVVMSPFQARYYLSEVEIEQTRTGTLKQVVANNNFYCKSRQKANIVYPNGLHGYHGLNKLTAAMIKDNLATYSAKFASLIKGLRNGELSFIFSNFTGPGGIASVAKILKVYGYKNFTEDGPGKKTFAIWSGEQSMNDKNLIRTIYNSSDNDDASKIQIVIGSPSICVGVSLLRTRYAYILEPFWSKQKMDQVIGRVCRLCSHKNLKASERTVTVYVYAAVVNNKVKESQLPTITANESVDLYMIHTSNEKFAETEPYTKALMDIAFDKALHQ